MRPGEPSRSFGTDAMAQSAVVGYVLVLGLVIAGTGAVVVLGSGALDDTRRATQLQRAEHSMTLLDSRSAQVALGSTPVQTVPLRSTSGGSFHPEPGGRVVIEHLNYTGDGDNETLYDDTLGAFVYENGKTTIAYEGGGVWRTQDEGTQMVSPPEFHYRDATLTLPIIRVDGSGGAAGSVDARVSPAAETRRVFPNASADYDDTGDEYDNPILNGTVLVSVQSRHYRGWADYFRTRTEGNVSVSHENQTASVELQTVGQDGAFDIVGRDGSVSIRAMAEGHSVDDFTLTFGQGTSANPQYFSLYASSGSQTWETVVELPESPWQWNGMTCPIDQSTPDLAVETYYHDGTGDHHAWSNTSVNATEGDVQLTCVDGEPALQMDLTGDTNLTLGSLQTTSDSSPPWQSTIRGSNASYANLSGHSAHGEPTNFTTTGSPDDTSMDHLTNHYFARLGPEVDLYYTWGTGAGNPIDLDDSGGNLEYEAGGSQYLTFLHVTENEVHVRVD